MGLGPHPHNLSVLKKLDISDGVRFAFREALEIFHNIPLSKMQQYISLSGNPSVMGPDDEHRSWVIHSSHLRTAMFDTFGG
jgi:hypothetical protein